MSFSVSRLTMFAIISAVEEDLRHLIFTELQSCGSEDAILGPKLYGKVLERSKKDVDFGERLSVQEFLPYADLGDLFAVLNSNRQHLRPELASGLRANTQDLQKIVPIRNRIMHTRPFTVEDFAFVMDTARRLSKDSNGVWNCLRQTLSRLNTEPSFVLNLDIPAQDWEPKNQNHNLPLPEFDDTGFVGRLKEVEHLVALCTSQWPIISVVGEGGIGQDGPCS